MGVLSKPSDVGQFGKSAHKLSATISTRQLALAGKYGGVRLTGDPDIDGGQVSESATDYKNPFKISRDQCVQRIGNSLLIHVARWEENERTKE